MRRAVRPLLLSCLTAACMACASNPAAPPAPLPGYPVAVLTPRDAVPIRARDALSGGEGTEAADVEAARAETLAALRGDLAASLRAQGLTVDEVAPSGPLPKPGDARHLAELGRAAGARYVLDTELIAYGDIRRSWLWVLGGQALLAGIGHGVVVASATGNSTLAWQVGAAEFLIETVTWVGGALIGGRMIDPVLVHARLIDTASGRRVGRFTREGLRPWRQWLRRRGLPPRAERLRSVAHVTFEHMAPKVRKTIERQVAHAPPAQPSHVPRG